MNDAVIAMDPEQALFESGLRRITRGMVALAAAGCLVCLVLRGWKWAVAYLLGAAASSLNFRWLKRVVDSMGATSRRRLSPKFRSIRPLQRTSREVKK